MTLKVRNQDFLIATCQTYVDLPIFFFLWKSAIFHSIKLPFDAEVAEKILNGIYWTRVLKAYKMDRIRWQFWIKCFKFFYSAFLIHLNQRFPQSSYSYFLLTKGFEWIGTFRIRITVKIIPLEPIIYFDMQTILDPPLIIWLALFPIEEFHWIKISHPDPISFLKSKNKQNSVFF